MAERAKGDPVEKDLCILQMLETLSATDPRG